MMNYSRILKDAAMTGAVSAAATTAAAAVAGQVENGNAIAPLNAISHIAWGEKAARRDKPSWKYTLMGVALNAAAVTSWALIYEALFGKKVDRDHVVTALVGGAIVSTGAYVTDYYVVPPRVTPGFEKRLSGGSLFGVYSVLALSLAAGALLGRRRR